MKTFIVLSIFVGDRKDTERKNIARRFNKV